MLVCPVAVDVGVEFFFSGAHQADEGLVAGVFVTGGPKNHFGEHGSEVNALGRKRIDALAPIRGISLRGNYSVLLEAAQAVGQDIGGNPFIGSQELVESFVAAQHHVTKNKEGPAIAEHLDGGVQRTSRPTLGSGPLFRHFITVAHFHLHGASKVGTLSGGNGGGRASVKGSEAEHQVNWRTS